MIFNICRVDEISTEEISQLEKKLSKVQLNYILRKPHAKRRQSLAARVLLYKLLKEHYPELDVLNLRFNDRGKPYIDGSENLYLSITHSHDMVGCAISDCPIGIDIEKVRCVSDKVMTRVCTADEINYIKTHSTLDFFRFWTLKEALFKASEQSFAEILKISLSDGKEIVDDLPQFKTFFDNNSEYFWSVAEFFVYKK